jgi:hypothetical protein
MVLEISSNLPTTEFWTLAWIAEVHEVRGHQLNGAVNRER